MIDLSFYKKKKILITGNTGFKGAWLSKILLNTGAEVYGYSLQPVLTENLFNLLHLDKEMHTDFNDIRDLENLQKEFNFVKPDIVFHLAAQPIVRESYINPVKTFDINVMGTVNLLECVRLNDNVRSVINVTTDKVYLNIENNNEFKEDDILCGQDPYSSSKSSSELVTYSYIKSFFNKSNSPAISTVRAGNVIGGGDFSKDRIIPDCVRFAINQESIIVRNPNSIRPYQHVLDCLYGYLLLAEKQYLNKDIYSSAYNFGPNIESTVSTGKLAEMFCNEWGDDQNWRCLNSSGPHEAAFLRLNCRKAHEKLKWQPQWSIEVALSKTVQWYKEWSNGGNIVEATNRQINEFFI